ncbi:hybrid sensor histidine kinase/response regulator [Roseateles koreensis]|uniref:histidine kinase n=1 Tax=Roseateles koreensis TaxID=2987526 RepID=A0ABT5KRX3_9BURK|nr:PAS domain-containing sensor histidine kinase [Roseateles koreensis]MDC8785683.1 ATP-binding protein [Roseateles koreensis]
MAVVTRMRTDDRHALDQRLLQIAARLSELGAWIQERGPAGRFHASGKAHDILNVPSGSLQSLADCWAVLQDQDRAAAELAQAQCEAGGRAYTLEFRLPELARSGPQDADVGPVWLRVQAVPMFGPDGSVSRVEGAFFDISAAKSAELALQDSDMRFRALIEGVERVSVQGYDSQRRVIFWNKASERLYGYSADEAIGRQLEDLIIPGTMRAQVIEGTQQWLQSGVVSAPAEELVLCDKAGAPVPVFSSHTLQYSRSGEPLLFCVDIDLRERVKAEALRHQLESQLREAQKIEALGIMAGGIAHDFNNVLGAILSNVNLASALLGASHPSERHLRLITQGAERARSMVKKLLTFSRRDAPHPQWLALAEQLRDTLDLLRAGLPSQVTLSLGELDETLQVEADAAELQQVLFNLCTNASQALPPEGGTVRVSLYRCQLPEDRPLLQLPPGLYAQLSVCDNGSGISEAQQARIFEPFFTTKPAGEGTGLGLSVVHGIVHRHQGSIVLDSREGEGSCFHVLLPCATAVNFPANLSPPDPPGISRPSEKGDKNTMDEWGHRVPRLLYVDDDEVMRLTAQSLLQRAGYQVETCASADAAMHCLGEANGPSALLAGSPFAAVISDYNMPDRDGFSLADALRQTYPGLPVILASGHVSDSMQLQAHALGLAPLIKKENLLEELVAAVDRRLVEMGRRMPT